MMYGRPPVGDLARRLRKEGSAKILFLSNHGAARALIAEAIVKRHSASGLHAVAAGLRPENSAHPMAEELLRAYRLPSPRTRPLSFEEAMDTEARHADFVVALWDRSSGEPWPKQRPGALAASWDVPDPRRPYNAGAGIIGSRLGFVRSYLGLRQRIEQFFYDVSAEQCAAGGPVYDPAAAERRAIAEPSPEADLSLGDNPDGLSIGGKKTVEKPAKRGWRWGGVFGREASKRPSATEPLSLGRAQLVRDERR